MTKTRAYFIKATPEITDTGAIRFTKNEAVPVSRIQENVWYLADDNAEPVNFVSNQPHGREFEITVAKTWKFKTRKQIRFDETGTKIVRDLKLV